MNCALCRCDLRQIVRIGISQQKSGVYSALGESFNAVSVALFARYMVWFAAFRCFQFVHRSTIIRFFCLAIAQSVILSLFVFVSTPFNCFCSFFLTPISDVSKE